MKDTSKPFVFKAILTAFLFIANLYLSCIIIVTILAFIVAVIIEIPILKNILLIFLDSVDHTVFSFVGYISIMSACCASISLIEGINKHIPTRKLSLKLSSLTTVILNVFFLVTSILSHTGNWRSNLGFIIAGLVTLYHASKYKANSEPAASVKHESEAESASQKTEPIYLMEAANGMIVRVPESKLEAWQEAQDRIRNDPSAVELTEEEKKLKEDILRRIYGPRE